MAGAESHRGSTRRSGNRNKRSGYGRTGYGRLPGIFSRIELVGSNITQDPGVTPPGAKCAKAILIHSRKMDHEDTQNTILVAHCRPRSRPKYGKNGPSIAVSKSPAGTLSNFRPTEVTRAHAAAPRRRRGQGSGILVGGVPGDWWGLLCGTETSFSDEQIIPCYSV